MQKEIEVKYLDIDVKKLQKLLKQVVAKKKFDTLFEEWIFFKDEWRPKNGRIRIRKHDNDIFFTYKESIGSNLDGNYETEFKVDNLNKAIEFARKMAPQRRRQQKRRICYDLDGATVDIDFWPKIPPLVEIEAKSKSAVEKLIKKLQLQEYQRFEFDAYYVYKNVYKIELDKIKEVVF
jgi:adenylate cyclase class 2